MIEEGEQEEKEVKNKIVHENGEAEGNGKEEKEGERAMILTETDNRENAMVVSEKDLNRRDMNAE